MYFRRIWGDHPLRLMLGLRDCVLSLSFFYFCSVNCREVFLSQKLVSTEWLASHLNDSTVRMVEVAFHPDDSSCREGHVPGAVWWYWKDMLWHETDREFPTPGSMAQRLGRAGISPETTLVLYGDPVQFGTYAFWVLSMCGHPDLRILDGGKARWAAEKRPVSKEVPILEPVSYPPQPGDGGSRVGRDELRAGLGIPGRLLLDARSPEEYRGERVMPAPGFDHGAERKGRIPGAVHFYYRDLLNDDDTFKEPDALYSLFEEKGAAPGAAADIVTYCRLSHRATLVWFAMRHILGYENARVYDGSWTEWGSIVGFPVEM